MSYMQIELGGKERGLKFNMGAVDEYWQKVNFQAISSSSGYATIYAGLIGNDIAKGVTSSGYEYEQVTEWVDELSLTDEGMQTLREAVEMFEQTAFYRKRLEQIHERIRKATEETEKKKTETP